MSTEHRDDEEARFAREAARLLREDADGLDAATLSRLNRARQAALAEYEAARRRPAWLRAAWQPALGAAAVAVLAVAVWAGREAGTPQLPPGEAARGEAVLDLDVVLAEDNLELLGELDFYDWVSSAPAADDAAAPGRTG